MRCFKMSIKNEAKIEKDFTETMLAEIEGKENSLELLEDVKARIKKMLCNLADQDDIIGGDELLPYCRIQLKVVNFLIFCKKEELKK